MSVVTEAQPIPVNALFEGDFITHLVLLLDSDTAGEAAGKIAQLVVGSRVRAREAPYILTFEGSDVPAERNISEAGITPLSEVFVRYAG